MITGLKTQGHFFKGIVLEGAIFFFVLGFILSHVLLPFAKIRHDLDTKINFFATRLETGKKYLSLIKKEDKIRLLYQGKTKLDTPEALASLERLASKTGVILGGLRPKEVLKSNGTKGSYTETPFDLEFFAKEDSLAHFLIGLRSLDFLCRIVRLVLSPDIKNEGLVIGQLRLEKIDDLEPCGSPAQEILFGSLPGSLERQEGYLSFAAGRQLFKAPFVLQSKDIQIPLGKGEEDPSASSMN